MKKHGLIGMALALMGSAPLFAQTPPHSAPTPAAAAKTFNLTSRYINESFDTGQKPEQTLHYPLKNRLGAITPISVPGAKTILTENIVPLVGDPKTLFLFVDWALGSSDTTPASVIPGSKWFPTLGLNNNPGADEDAAILARFIIEHYGANAPVVVYCQFPHSWLSYNAVLRLSKLGLTNIQWYRGGLLSWTLARPELKTEPVLSESGTRWLLNNMK